jgi:acetylornithine/succinyldiaminopimelate/putrescine aminotransferase
MIEAVIDIIESENLLENVRTLSAQMRETCIVGPVVGMQGAGFLAGLRTRRPACEVQRELLAHDILTGTSGDPHVVRILAPFVLTSAHIAQLATTLATLPP